jgi:hypothetical protein
MKPYKPGSLTVAFTDLSFAAVDAESRAPGALQERQDEYLKQV